MLFHLFAQIVSKTKMFTFPTSRLYQ